MNTQSVSTVAGAVSPATKVSLSFLASIWSASAIAVSMGVYAVFQYYSTPGSAVMDLFLKHLWHVLVLGIMIYVLLWFILKKVLLKPIQRIHLHLYKVSTGRIEPLELETNVQELDTIVKGINFLVGRMGEGVPDQEIAAIREAVMKLHDTAPSETQEILEHLSRLNEMMVAPSRKSPHGAGTPEKSW